jgi:type II secretory pathway pseudopilin PulG
LATCPQCGNAVNPNDRFCPICGRDLLGPAAVVTPPAVATPILHQNASAAVTQTHAPSFASGPAQTSGKAIASLVLGIFGFFSVLPAIPAIILGHLSLSDIKKSLGRLRGRRMAITGLVLGYGGLVATIPIVLILAAIVLPRMVKGRIAADESSAMASLRAINNAELRYQVTYGGFACRLDDLGGASGSCSPSAEHACLLDDTLASGRKNGYVFLLQNCSGAKYTVAAYPQQFNATGVRSFCSDQDGVIRYSQSGTPERCISEGEPYD